MFDFLDGVSKLEYAYWMIALIGSAIFLIIFILTFIGFDSDVDMDADGTDFSADDGGVGFQFFTFKNLMAFFTMFGWVGIICVKSDFSNIASLVVATLAGLATMTATAALFYYIGKLTQSGTLKMKNAIGAVGEVYIPIGAARSSIGKIQVKVQGSLRELDAVTDSKEKLSTGTIVKVKEIVSTELLLVETYK